MSREVPFFSARKLNTAKDYVRFFHTLTYLRQRSDSFQGPQANRALLAACGYRRFEKWTRRRPEFDALTRPIPLPYLKEIGASLDVLALTVKVDQEEYRAALALPLSPRWGIERVMAAVYRDIRLPDGVSEEQALNFMREHSRRTQCKVCINYPGLKAVYIEPDGRTSTVYYPPTLCVRGGFLVTGGDGKGVGVCSIGR